MIEKVINESTPILSREETYERLREEYEKAGFSPEEAEHRAKSSLGGSYSKKYVDKSGSDYVYNKAS